MNPVPHTPPRKALVKKRTSLSPVWFIPIFAGFIAFYLVWRTVSDQGPVIVIAFNSADGLVAGQTQLKYKAVSLGTVTGITLGKDRKDVLVKARLNKEARAILSAKARFWVVRPRFNYGSISGFETLVSGAYIQCDPGEGDGNSQTYFVGLENPPALRQDEPGTTLTLKADKLGPISAGSPVYFRDVNVGEVVHYDIGDGFDPITLNVFIREPYDRLVHKETHFWNSSSLSVGLGPGGLQVQLQSLQSLLAGGISFGTRIQWKDTPPAPRDTVFRLYNSKQEAEVDSMSKRIAFVTYFQASVKNIVPGSPVSIYGIQVGEVTSVNLLFDTARAEMRVRVKFEIQPERSFLVASSEQYDPLEITRTMVAKGLRASIDSGGFIPGQQGLAIGFEPTATPVENVTMEEGSILLPSSSTSSLDTILHNVSDISTRLNQIPFVQIGNNLNTTLEGVSEKSDLQRSAKRTLDELGDTARSVRLLADFLSNHPEALLRGRDSKDKQ